MTSAWHWFITLVTVANILACLWLIAWSSRQGAADKDADDTLDHSWDGDLTERNNPLPRWWLYLFVGSIIWGFGYLAWYPGLGSFAGFGNWGQIAQYEAERARVDAVYHEKFAALEALGVDELSRNAQGMDIARRLFGANCATCHGADGRGATGFPNLTDDDWLHGSSADAIAHTINFGRQGVMPPWGAALGEHGASQLIAYLRSLAGSPHNAFHVAAGKDRYATLCAACHGPDAKGIQALGAPNLADTIWLYGRSDDAIAQSITEGRIGVMPAHKDLLSTAEVKLLTAYVLSLARPPTAGSSN